MVQAKTTRWIWGSSAIGVAQPCSLLRESKAQHAERITVTGIEEEFSAMIDNYPGDNARHTIDSRLKVAVIIPQLIAGGVETSMQTLSYGLQECGAAVEIVVYHATASQLEAMPPVPVHSLGVSRTLVAVPPLVKYLRDRRPDVVISGPTFMNLAAIISTRLARTGACLCLNEQGNLSLDVVQRENRFNPKMRMLPLLVRALYRYADAIVAPATAPFEDPLFSRMVGHLDVPTKIIPNPIRWDAERSAANPVSDPWLSDRRTAPTLVAVGRLAEQKAHDVLLRALAHLKNQGIEARLIILGEGPHLKSLQRLAQQLNISDQVQFAGYVSNATAYISKADAFVMPSRWEGFSMARLEAMACGAPMVLSDAAAAAGADIIDGSNALVAPVDDATALASAIARLLTDPDFAARIGENARETSTAYSPRAIATEYLDFLQTLLATDPFDVSATHDSKTA